MTIGMSGREVKFQDLARLHCSVRPELDAAFGGVLESSAFIQGKYVKAFESQFAEFTRIPKCLGVANGTDALEIALRAVGVQPGDVVLVPSMTFAATAEAVVNVGGIPVFVDVAEDTLCSTRKDFEEALERGGVHAVRGGKRPKALIAVHLHGRACPVSETAAFAQDHGLTWIEDCAQAHGARVDGLHVGSFSKAGTFSFYPGKNLGALGDAGAVVTTDAAVAENVVKQRDHGRKDKYLHDTVGRNSRLDGLQAAFLAVKLKHLPLWTEKRREIAGRYHENLSHQTGASNDRFKLLVRPPKAEEHVYHNFVVRILGAAGSREKAQEFLKKSGIETLVHYPLGLHQQPAFKQWAEQLSFCNATKQLSTEVLSLPMDPLMTSEDVDFVCEGLLQAVKGL